MRNADLRKVSASAIQKQFWLIQQIAPENSAYNVVEAYNIQGVLNLEALEKAVQAMVARYDIFRTFYGFEEGDLVQCIVSEAPFRLRLVDLSADSGRDQGPSLDEVLRTEAIKPFDLGTCPLLRLTVVRRQSDVYTIMFVLHHSIVDLESSRIFAREIGALYSFFAGFGPMDLKTVQNQYADYVRWQQQWLQGDSLKAQSKFWSDALKGTSGYFQFPTDKRRPAVQTLKGGTYRFCLDSELVQGLRAFIRENHVNLFLTLLSAYVVMLHRYSGQTDIVIGVPLTNRRETSHQGILGCFVNTLPLVVNVDDKMSFKELVRQVRSGMLGAHRNQEIPLANILDAVQPIRNSSYNPLYQVGFTFAPPMPLSLEAVDVQPTWVHHGGSQLDIFATFWEDGRGGGLEGYFEYNTAIFDSWRIQNLAANFRALLSSLPTAGDDPVGLLSVVADSEKQAMKGWNDTDAAFTVPATLHRWFATQAAKTPEAVAIEYENSALTYAELDRRADQLANFLANSGVGPETLVGVYLDRCTEMVVALLGILKAGGAYVPLDPDFPTERVAYMLTHSAAPVVLTKRALKGDLPGGKATVICMDTDWARISGFGSGDPHVAVGAENLAYVIYTSGSTGLPKGVQISHGAVVNFLASMRREPGIQPLDVLLAVTTLSFDISVLELFLPLVSSAKTVIVSRKVALDGQLLRDALQSKGATIMQATPTTWRLLLSAGWEPGGDFKALCGGEALPADLACSLVEKVGGVWNMYGPTETTIWSTCCRIADKQQPISVGRPIANTRTYILDAFMNPVPVGVLGELYIGGAGVARGYLNAPELTRDRFLADPFSDVPGACIYKTGDWCRYLEDGNIEFLNRVDNQVKVHGFRIELGDIETALNQHQAVKVSAAAVHEKAAGDKMVVGYVVPHTDMPSAELLRGFLLEKLPYYMVPSLFIEMESLPLTPNAKIDRKALPLPGTERPDLDAAFVAPSDEPEKKMAAIWCELLTIDRIGVHDSFFVLGGTSLLSMRMISRINEAFQSEIRVAKLFQFPTIRSLLNAMQEKVGTDVTTDFSERAKHRKLAYVRRRSHLN